MPASNSQDSLASRISVARPHSHQLPPGLMWGITFAIAACTAMMNFAIVQATVFLMHWKIRAMQVAIDGAGVWAGMLVLVACSAAVCAAGAALICTLSPVCAGGGLPEMKGYLNGNRTNGLFRFRNFAVRLLGTIAAVASGLPTGREGPTISLGCHVGYGVVQLLASPYVRRWVDIDTSNTGSLPALLIDEERFLHAKRLGCALGGAAGMAAIFDAPLGGLLYMLEEVTLASWTPELNLRAIVCTLLCVLFNRALMRLAGDHITDFLIYVTTSEQAAMWGWIDLLLFLALAVVLGVLGALLTRALTAAFRARRRLSQALQRWQPFAKIAECTLHGAVCALLFALVPLAGSCRAAGTENALLRFNCKGGWYNPVAELLLKGPEESIKQFYVSYGAGDMNFRALLISFAAYTALNIGTIGLPIPIGNFIPAMFIGGLIGRTVGQVLFDLAPEGLALPSIYALIGSGAMLAGVTRHTLAIVVFLCECVDDMHLIPPLMLTVFVSHKVAECMNREALEEQLIEIKGVPFLDAELPRKLEQTGVLAVELCDELPRCAGLSPEASAGEVLRALRETQASVFPVLRGDTCLGLATRPRLRAALRALETRCSGASSAPGTSSGASAHGRSCSEGTEGSSEVTDGDVDGIISSILNCSPCPSLNEEGAPSSRAVTVSSRERRSVGAMALPLLKLADPAPYTVLENTPAPRVYPLFTRLGIRAACVISAEGKFRGVISRDSLIAHVQSQHGPGRSEVEVETATPASAAAAATAPPDASTDDSRSVAATVTSSHYSL